MGFFAEVMGDSAARREDVAKGLNKLALAVQSLGELESPSFRTAMAALQSSLSKIGDAEFELVRGAA